jgi:molybdate transport system substrate-binding protein
MRARAPYDAVKHARFPQGLGRMRRSGWMLRRSILGMKSLMLLLFLVAAIGCDGTRAKPGPPAPLRIAAASDLQVALPKLKDQFQASTGIATELSFGASGRLAEQIKAGAPFDVFLAANQAFVRDLAEGGFVKRESVHHYARGSLVLAVYHELGDQVRSLADLTKPELKKIALANPATAPYGKAGKQALERAGLWAQLEPKIVLADSVGQALLYAQKGDAEAALVGRAIASVPGVQVVEVDPQLYDPIVQALGIVAASSRTADAEQFARFVLGEDGQRILRESGFAPAGSNPSASARSQKHP